ncbi:MAG: hypothetical protein ACI4F1_08315 [Bariatricus sp.]
MKRNVWIRWGVAILLSAALLLVFASHTSPIYSLLLGNYGNNNASSAMLIGKAWAQGTALPYRDLFSLGGPLYFLLQALGWMAAGRIGVFALEVMSFAVFLGLIAKTAERFVSKKMSAVCLIVSAIVYAALCASGNSTFEWCLPFIAGGYAVILHPEIKVRNRDVLLMGLLCGCVLMIDFRAGGLLYGIAIWAVFCAPCSENDNVWKRLFGCLIGLAVPVLVVVCGFAMAGALREMLLGTFVYPMYELLSGFDSLQVMLHKGVKCLLLLPLLAGGLLHLRRDKRLGSTGSAIMISAILCGIILLGGDNQWYYYLAALPAIPVGIALLYSEKDSRHPILAAGCGILLVAGLIVVPLKNYLLFLVAGVPDVAYEFYEDAQSFEEENPGYRYLAVDTDSSYFLALDKMPQCRYFTDQTKLASYDLDVEKELEEYMAGNTPEVLFITERGYIGRELASYSLTQVYLRYGGSLFVYMKND